MNSISHLCDTNFVAPHRTLGALRRTIASVTSFNTSLLRHIGYEKAGPFLGPAFADLARGEATQHNTVWHAEK
jgi:hypothetical protein